MNNNASSTEEFNKGQSNIEKKLDQLLTDRKRNNTLTIFEKIIVPLVVAAMSVFVGILAIGIAYQANKITDNQIALQDSMQSYQREFQKEQFDHQITVDNALTDIQNMQIKIDTQFRDRQLRLQKELQDSSFSVQYGLLNRQQEQEEESNKNNIELTKEIQTSNLRVKYIEIFYKDLFSEDSNVRKRAFSFMKSLKTVDPALLNALNDFITESDSNDQFVKDYKSAREEEKKTLQSHFDNANAINPGNKYVATLGIYYPYGRSSLKSKAFEIKNQLITSGYTGEIKVYSLGSWRSKPDFPEKTSVYYSDNKFKLGANQILKGLESTIDNEEINSTIVSRVKNTAISIYVSK